MTEEQTKRIERVRRSLVRTMHLDEEQAETARQIMGSVVTYAVKDAQTKPNLWGFLWGFGFCAYVHALNGTLDGSASWLRLVFEAGLGAVYAVSISGIVKRWWRS